MRRLTLLVLALVGFGVAGATVFLWSTPTDATYYLDAVPVGDGELGDGPVAAYENLSADNRRLFDRALGNGSATVGSDTTPLNARYVEHEGTYYETTVRPVEPDDGAGLARLGTLAVGGLGALVGTFGLLGFWVTSWARSRAEADRTNTPGDDP